MADGSYTRPRSAASNELPLGTKIRIISPTPGPGGLRLFVIRDRIGYGTQLDLWNNDCRVSVRWGRHTLKIKRGWKR